ncbi:hypothetical protein ACC721_37485, partial [Rhizobium ruizarguesonis]
MTELVTQIAARVGIAPASAAKALGMMLGFLPREAADGPVAQMIEAIPGGAAPVAPFTGAGAGGCGPLG